MRIYLWDNKLRIQSLEKKPWEEKDIRKVIDSQDPELVEDLKKIFRKAAIQEILILEEYRSDPSQQLLEMLVIDRNRKVYYTKDLLELMPEEAELRRFNEILTALIRWNCTTYAIIISALP